MCVASDAGMKGSLCTWVALEGMHSSEGEVDCIF
jgi:hypothetical protein